MNSKLLFLLNFIKNPKEVAALAPSSRYVIKKVIKNINFKKAKCIVEYGPGIGTVTKKLLENMHSDSRLICFETNPDFCKFIKSNITDKRLNVINDSADKLEIYLNKFKLEKVDYILSALPFSLIKKDTKESILKKTRDRLNKTGKFIVFQQYNKHLKKYLELYFKRTSVSMELRNLPPTNIYICEKT